ncbi:MAG: 50S ribosomal protein L20 [Alphaproteobacteria bacterium]|nr:50S ribosomal protein L20 [Alphaproteobacteria bacterium]
MPRARGRVPAHARHVKVIKAAKGFYGRRKNTFRTAQAAVVKSGVNAFKGRKQKKRNFRSLWIQRINAAVREIDETLTYSRFIDGLTKAGVQVDRKVMSQLAISEPVAFGALVEKARSALAA